MTRTALVLVSALLITLMLVSAVLFLKAASEAPQTEWEKTYGPVSGASVVQASDGGYVIGGIEGVWYRPPRGIPEWVNRTSLLIKTNSTGDVEWKKTYGNPGETSYADAVIQTADGGYAIAGRAPGGDFWLAKTDSSGDVRWSRTYGGPEQEYALSVVRTAYGGYLLPGRADGPDGFMDGWIVNTDSRGLMQWNRYYGGDSHDAFSSATQTADGGYAVVGTANLPSNESFVPATVVVKLDFHGEVEWEYQYEGETEFSIRSLSIVEASDGGLVYVGAKKPGGANSTVWLVKIAPSETTNFDTETLTTILVVAILVSVAFVSLGLIVYFKRRNH